MNQWLLTILVFAPLIGAAIVYFLPRHNKKLVRRVGIAATIPSLLIILYIFASYLSGTSLDVYTQTATWFSFASETATQNEMLYTVQYKMTVDGLSLVMMLLTAFLSTVAVISSTKITKSVSLYYVLLLVLETAMLGVFASGNMIMFFVFFELTIITAFFLIAKWGGAKKEKASMQFLIYNAIGSLLLLFVIMVFQARVGTTDFEYLAQNMSSAALGGETVLSENLRNGMFIAILIAFFIKLPAIPLHSWMVKTHKEAPTPVVMLHSGVLLKIGAYAMLRFGVMLFPEQFEKVAPFLILLGAVTVLYGALVAMAQTDLRAMFAYASVSHMGFIIMGIGAATELSFVGVILMMVSHGLISALMFLLVGVLENRFGTTEIGKIRGLQKAMPVFAGVFIFGTMALIGVPGLSGFVSEIAVLLGSFEGHGEIVAIACVALIFTTIYGIRAMSTTCFGELETSGVTSDKLDLHLSEKLSAFALMAAILVIGIFPNVVAMPVQDFINSLVKVIGGY